MGKAADSGTGHKLMMQCLEAHLGGIDIRADEPVGVVHIHAAS